MASKNAFADIIRDWDNLLAACKDNGETLQAAEPQRAEMEKLTNLVRDLKDRQESLTAARQEVTQKLTQAVLDGREAARRLRGAVKANLGTKTERLVQFKVAPNRPRGPRKPKTAPPVPPPPAEQPPAA
jgi:chromosome segregation ATPase